MAARAAGSEGDTPRAGTETMAEVVVEGRHEGPRMWRVRQGDHVLWILGTVSPLPKKMVWQPDQVQAVLGQVQEVIPAWPSYGIGANPITALRLYIQWRHMQKPPDHLPLRETLPPDLYARVQALKAAQHAYCLQEGRVALRGAASALTREAIAAAYFGV